MKTPPVESNDDSRRSSEARRKTGHPMVWTSLGLVLWITAGYVAFIQIDRLIVSKAVYRNLLERGIAAEAKIMARDHSGGKQYAVSYMFHTLDAELKPAWFAKNTRVSASTFQHLTDALHVSILYDPLDPNASRIQQENKPPDSAQYAYAGFAVMFCMSGLVIFIRGILKVRQR